MSSIFGGSKGKSQETSTQYNKAYDTLSSAFGPMFGNAATGANALVKLLQGDASGFNAYKNATGYDAAAEQGSRGITGNAAASGLLRSGSTAKGLQAFGNNLQNQYAQSYMDRLLGLANTGFQAGNLVSGAGNYQYGQGTKSDSTKPGLGGFLGTVGAGIAASDRRLKQNIRKVGELPFNLGLYTYDYVDGSGPHVGVMADEVEKKLPEALGPTIGGFKTVNYDVLKEKVNGAQPS